MKTLEAFYQLKDAEDYFVFLALIMMNTLLQ